MHQNESGRRRAALRVQQASRTERRRWSPSGVKRGTRHGRAHGRSSRTNHAKKELWNDRFIFDDDTPARHDGADLVPVQEKGRKQRSTTDGLHRGRHDGKENRTNNENR